MRTYLASMKHLAGLLLLFSSLAFAQVSNNTVTISTSGGTAKILNPYGGLVGAFEEVINGSPSTVSITIQGCMKGATCDTAADTNTSTSNSIRNVNFTKAYNYFLVTASWTGGTSPSVTVNYSVTTAVLNTGGGGGGSLSGMSSGQVPIAATATSVTSSIPLYGSEAGIASASDPGTTVNVPMVSDGAHGTVPSGSGALGSNAYTNTSYLPLTGGTLTGALSGTTATMSGAMTATSDGVHAGSTQLAGNTTAPALGANTFSWVGPNSASFTNWGIQANSVAPTTASLEIIGAVSSNLSQQSFLAEANGTIVNGASSAWSATATPTLGVTGTTTGTLKLSSAGAGGSNTITPGAAITSAYTTTLPANTGTLAETNFAQTFSAVQTISASNGLVLSAMTGTTCLEQISGVVTSTGSACGSGGSGNISGTWSSTGNVVTTDGSATAQDSGVAMPAGLTCSAHYHPIAGSSDQISAAGAFATTASVATTCIAAGTLITVRAHGVFTTTATSAPKGAFEINAGGTTGICPGPSSVSTLSISLTNAYWDAVCYIQINTTGAPGTAVVWGSFCFSDSTSTNIISISSAVVPGCVAFANAGTGTVSYTTNAAETVSVQETGTLVSGQTFNLTSIDITVND